MRRPRRRSAVRPQEPVFFSFGTSIRIP
jgi:hypothetical protein